MNEAPAKPPLVALDLFSGIGGFALGLGRAGIATAAFCECDGYARRVLKKHWPTAWIYEDIRTLTAKRLKKDGISVNVITGGFPCQDISTAGKGAGIEGSRSGLWKEYARLIREIRPKYAIMENVAALRSRGLSVVIGDLAAIGYDAEWHCIPASAIGAPHERDRVWIVGHTNSPKRIFNEPKICQERLENANKTTFWRRPNQSGVCGVANGVPSRVDRLRCLGNSVVPQIPELLARAVKDHYEGATQ